MRYDYISQIHDIKMGDAKVHRTMVSVCKLYGRKQLSLLALEGKPARNRPGRPLKIWKNSCQYTSQK